MNKRVTIILCCALVVLSVVLWRSHQTIHRLRNRELFVFDCLLKDTWSGELLDPSTPFGWSVRSKGIGYKESRYHPEEKRKEFIVWAQAPLTVSVESPLYEPAHIVLTNNPRGRLTLHMRRRKNPGEYKPVPDEVLDQMSPKARAIFEGLANATNMMSVAGSNEEVESQQTPAGDRLKAPPEE